MIKLYTARDSATSALRKIGLKACDYNLFITKVGDKFECELSSAVAHLEALKNLAPVVEAPKAKAEPAKSMKAGCRVGGPTAKTNPKRMGISQTARDLILEGKTNQEVWEVLKQTFNLGNSKKHYPTWYRCELKRKGLTG